MYLIRSQYFVWMTIVSEPHFTQVKEQDPAYKGLQITTLDYPFKVKYTLSTYYQSSISNLTAVIELMHLIMDGWMTV